jgi:phage terminase small subunit
LRKTLTPKQERFVQEYLVDLNATQAAIRAGYSPNTAKEIGYKLVHKSSLQQAIYQRRQRLTEKTEIGLDKLMAEYAVLAFSDMAHYLKFGDDGNAFLDWSNMPKDATRAIAEITQETYLEGSGDDEKKTIKRTRFKLHDKKGALDSIAARLWPIVTRNLNVDTTLKELKEMQQRELSSEEAREIIDIAAERKTNGHPRTS